MNDAFQQADSGHKITRPNRPKEDEEAFEHGVRLGRIDVMRSLLRASYGELADREELAEQLVDRDNDGNIQRIIAGASLADLRSGTSPRAS